MTEEYVGVNIPKKLYEEIKNRVNESQGQFRNVNEYVEFVLTQVVKEEEEEHEPTYTPEEEEEIKKRLKKLGYL